LEKLLGGQCYHMAEVLAQPEHIPIWYRAACGKIPDWHSLFKNYCAAVDWPVATFWPQLIETFPDALVILSLRDPDSWWQSARHTIFRQLELNQLSAEWKAMFNAILAVHRIDSGRDRELAIRAFIAHNSAVLANVNPKRLLVWHARDGWLPLCRALDKPVPDIPFPWINSGKEWSDPQPIEAATTT
jgi:hypothetical protein